MISVILSTNNEIRNHYLEKIFEAIVLQEWGYEIIVVDNKSTDGTVELCRNYTPYVFQLPDSNRAQRLNYGFSKSSWDIVLFHHSVALLPKNSFKAIDSAVRAGATWWGHLHSFDLDNFILRFTSWYSNFVRGRRGILYLDHCIFARRLELEKTSLFGEDDIFEDTIFSYNMLQFGKPKIISEKIVTSARRFQKRGILKQWLLNQYLKICFLLGKDHKKMNKVYEQKVGYNKNYN